uniref:Uncharacterized protein n=1 Tax=Ditylenchus dipsaci TaxID=166011 RepID=A0A915EAK5_9BILA
MQCLLNNSLAARLLTVAKVNVYKNFEMKIAQNATESQGVVKIMLSHVPLLHAFYLPAIKNIIDSFGPAIILSAHDHTAKVYIKNGSRMQEFELPNKPFRYLLALNNTKSEVNFVEFKTPTVSYRMGFQKWVMEF